MRYFFEDFLLETESRQLTRRGAAVTVEPQVFDLLEFLLKNNARFVSHDELIETIWLGRIVSESSLSARISAARAAIEDNGKEQRLIKTLAKKGFRFIGKVSTDETSALSTAVETDNRIRDLEALKPTTKLPSIAVLPFRNMGTTEQNSYFSEGIVEDIVLSLANLGELFVVSRGSTLMFRGNDVDVRQAGHKLGVRYVLGGSVLHSGNRLRVWAELTDVASGAAIWSERFNGFIDDIFAVQDEIVSDIVSQLSPRLREEELKHMLRRPPESYSAYDCMLRALDDFYTLRLDRFERAREWLEKSQIIDPTFSMASAWDAWLKMYRMAFGWSRDPENDLIEANRLAAHAVRLDARNARALATFGHLSSLFYRNYTVGAEYLARAVSVSPNDPLALALSSATNSYTSKPKEAIFQAEQAVRRSPTDPYRFYYRATLCMAHYVDRNYDEAARWGAIAMRDNPSFTPTLRYLAASLAASGRRSEARSIAEVFLKKQPKFTLDIYRSKHQPFDDYQQREEHVAHLQLAGFPTK